jgi:hypothetical protein
MTSGGRKIVKRGILAMLVIAVAAIVVMYRSAGQYGERLQASLSRALGRRVEFKTPVEFSLLHGPALYVGRVVIHEDPSIGIEPIAYVDGGITVRPSLWSLLGGKFVIASIRLEDASINLTKSGPAKEWGRWNFSSFVDHSTLFHVPAIVVRNSRIHFKFGEEKLALYLNETDLDISPGSEARGWSVELSARPARTDRPNTGLGEFTLRGRWFMHPERVDLDLVLDRTGLEEWTALLRGESGSVHGTLSSKVHFGGTLNNIGMAGRVLIEDVHRWDLMPTKGQGWPFQIRGKLDLISQQLEVQTTSESNVPAPVAVRFRASNYLAQPRWAVSVNTNQFPLEPLMELARHMGAQIPEKLKLAGTADGVIGYSGESGWQGELAFHGAALTIPDSPPLKADQAYVVVGNGHAHLSPAVVGTAEDQASIEADYAMDGNALDLTISTDSMDVKALRAQVALAAVPWLEQVQAGRWKGQLHYHSEGPAAERAAGGWSGALDVADAELAVPGLADPLQLTSAHAQIAGVKVVLDRIVGRAGNLAFTGDYRYEPTLARPHRLRLKSAVVDAADLEAELGPTLRRGTGLLAQALGRAPVPDWMRELALEGTLQIGDLEIAGAHVEDFRSRMIWVGDRVILDGIQAGLDTSALTGSLAINLRNARPSYRLTAKVRGLDYLSGKLDAECTVDSYGTGVQLLTHMTSDGTFTGSAWDLGATSAYRSVGGRFHLTWAGSGPRLHLTDLSLRDTDDTYTGNGATEENGHVIVLLTNGAREMRVSGPLAKLRVEEGK